jgi:hypothetical protein
LKNVHKRLQKILGSAVVRKCFALKDTLGNDCNIIYVRAE